MSDANPFLFLWPAVQNPYRSNPFALLGLPTDATTAAIEQFASARERLLAAGEQPVSDVVLRRGDCASAAGLLKDPVIRLACDLMRHHDVSSPSGN